jgi:hypothetical protein
VSERVLMQDTVVIKSAYRQRPSEDSTGRVLAIQLKWGGGHAIKLHIGCRHRQL